MDHEFKSIVEKLAILEGRLTPEDTKPLAEPKQKKPALFNNLKKDESAMPMVGGVEFAEDKMEEDVLGRVKASLADYLKSAEENLKHDTDLIAKKKQDLDLKKKELKDLTLQAKQGVKEAIPMTLEEAPQLEIGDPVCVVGPNHYEGEFGEVVEFSPSGKFVVIKFKDGDEASMHISDVELTSDESDWDEDDGVMFEPPKNKNHSIYKNEDDLDEDPNQTPAGGEGKSTLSDPTYAESATAPVKTMNVELDEDGGSVLVEIHGDERNGFCIKRAGKELPTRFKNLDECEIALEMYMARRKAKQAAEQNADYVEEK
jgi:hypothetical protein